MFTFILILRWQGVLDRPICYHFENVPFGVYLTPQRCGKAICINPL